MGCAPYPLCSALSLCETPAPSALESLQRIEQHTGQGDGTPLSETPPSFCRIWSFSPAQAYGRSYAAHERIVNCRKGSCEPGNALCLTVCLGICAAEE